jgi:ABC-type Mn2+/Zn2+ transport system permease subunit
MLELLRGEIISVSDTDLIFTAVVFALVVGTLFVFAKEFVLISFDREMGVTLRKSVLFWDALLFLLIGLTISVAVMSVGPMVAFGFLLLPPLIAYPFARTMRQLSLLASGIGGLVAFAGLAIAYRHDIPVGPTDVVLLGIVYGLSWTAQRLFTAWRTRKNGQLPAVP